MNRLIVPLAIVGMLALVFAIIGDVGFRDHALPDAGAVVDAAPPPPPPPPPPLPMDMGPAVDVGVPDGPPSVERYYEYGVLNQDPSVLKSFLGRNRFEPIESDAGPAFKDDLGTQLTFRVEGGRITGARADFAENSASATLTGLSWVFSSTRDHIPLHWESDTEPGKAYAGSWRDRFGRTIYYRGALHGGTMEMHGPAWIELSMRPFAPAAP